MSWVLLEQSFIEGSQRRLAFHLLLPCEVNVTNTNFRSAMPCPIIGNSLPNASSNFKKSLSIVSYTLSRTKSPLECSKWNPAIHTVVGYFGRKVRGAYRHEWTLEVTVTWKLEVVANFQRGAKA